MNLVKRFSPYFYLHSKEENFPISFDKYLQNSQLYYRGELVKDFNQINLDNLSEKKTVNGIEVNPTMDGGFTLSPNTKIYSGNKDLINVPIYAKVNEFPDYYQIAYFFFFGYNDGYNICCKVYGEHVFDLEHVTVQVLKNNMKIQKIFYSAHGSREGSWVPLNKIEFKEGHPVVYIAKGSHGCYHKKGIFLRIWGLANDWCNRGYLWKPFPIEVKESDPWTQYIGFYDNNKIYPLKTKKWWKWESSPNQLYNSFCRRVFICSE